MSTTRAMMMSDVVGSLQWYVVGPEILRLELG